MEASPLTQQSRPISFQPKITQLYEDLFKVRNPCPNLKIKAEMIRAMKMLSSLRGSGGNSSF